MHDDIQEILFSEEDIARIVRDLGERLSEDYRGLNPLVVCVLKGAAPFMSDLVRRMDIALEMDYMAVSSYGASSSIVRCCTDYERLGHSRRRTPRIDR